MGSDELVHLVGDEEESNLRAMRQASLAKFDIFYYIFYISAGVGSSSSGATSGPTGGVRGSLAVSA